MNRYVHERKKAANSVSDRRGWKVRFREILYWFCDPEANFQKLEAVKMGNRWFSHEKSGSQAKFLTSHSRSQILWSGRKFYQSYKNYPYISAHSTISTLSIEFEPATLLLNPPAKTQKTAQRNVEREKAPQVGLEPTTLRLTAELKTAKVLVFSYYMQSHLFGSHGIYLWFWFLGSISISHVTPNPSCLREYKALQHTNSPCKSAHYTIQ